MQLPFFFSVQNTFDLCSSQFELQVLVSWLILLYIVIIKYWFLTENSVE